MPHLPTSRLHANPGRRITSTPGLVIAWRCAAHPMMRGSCLHRLLRKSGNSCLCRSRPMLLCEFPCDCRLKPAAPSVHVLRASADAGSPLAAAADAPLPHALCAKSSSGSTAMGGEVRAWAAVRASGRPQQWMLSCLQWTPPPSGPRLTAVRGHFGHVFTALLLTFDMVALTAYCFGLRCGSRLPSTWEHISLSVDVYTTGSNPHSFSRSSTAGLRRTLIVLVPDLVTWSRPRISLAGSPHCHQYRVSSYRLIATMCQNVAPDVCQYDLPTCRRTHSAKRQPWITASGTLPPCGSLAADLSEAVLEGRRIQHDRGRGQAASKARSRRVSRQRMQAAIAIQVRAVPS